MWFAIVGFGIVAAVWLMGIGVPSSYGVDEDRPYGPRWRDRRPPGLPASARKAGVSGSAIPFIRAEGARMSLGPAFIQAMIQLSQNESGARIGLPAGIFNALPPERRGERPLITAWGAFQYNRAAWRRASGTRREPWETSVSEEVRVPMVELGRVWKRAKDEGAPDDYALRAVRLFHVAPALVDGYIARGSRGNWSVAWAGVRYTTMNGHDARDLIDRKLGFA